MWSSGPLLLLRVRLRRSGKSFRLFLGLAGYAVGQWLFSFAPALGLLPGKWGDSLREKETLLAACLRALSEGSPELNVSIEEKDGSEVSIKLIAPFQREGRQ